MQHAGPERGRGKESSERVLETERNRGKSRQAGIRSVLLPAGFLSFHPSFTGERTDSERRQNMDYAVTAQQMKAIDQNTINGVGIPSMVLMERAALAVTEAAERMAAERKLGKKARNLAVCGTGNNGADGVPAGRILQGRGYETVL